MALSDDMAQAAHGDEPALWSICDALSGGHIVATLNDVLKDHSDGATRVGCWMGVTPGREKGARTCRGTPRFGVSFKQGMKGSISSPQRE
jgi:hypothetical protein